MTTEFGEGTRDALIRAGELLMAARGIDAVDLTDIQAAAGQKNRSAVPYHFDDRAGRVRAIAMKHRGRINAERNRMIDGLDRRLRIGQAILSVPVLLADIARDINKHALTLAQGRRRVRHVTVFVTGALAADALRG